jgi:ferric-dicitrate binding protein FerR (iron transport regulator)
MRQLKSISLIHKELTGEISPEESGLLNEWLMSHQDNRDTYEVIKAVWESSASYKAPFTPNVDLAFQKQLERINSEQVIEPKVMRMKPSYWVSAIAASVIFLISALMIWNNYNPNQFSASDDIVNVILKDGSELWINKGSSVTLDPSFGSKNRNVTLIGEAYFDVARDETLPFVINAGQLNIKVLGTEFNVRSIDFTTNSVAVQEGRVQVTTQENSITISDGEYVKLSPEGYLEKSILNDSNEFNWKNNVLVFDDAPLADVVEDLSSFYNTPIEVIGGGLECPITYTKPVKSDIESILLVLSKAYDLNYNINPSGGYTITSVSCE